MRKNGSPYVADVAYAVCTDIIPEKHAMYILPVLPVRFWILKHAFALFMRIDSAISLVVKKLPLRMC